MSSRSFFGVISESWSSGSLVPSCYLRLDCCFRNCLVSAHQNCEKDVMQPQRHVRAAWKPQRKRKKKEMLWSRRKQRKREWLFNRWSKGLNVRRWQFGGWMSKGVEDIFVFRASAKPMPPDAQRLLRVRLHKALQSGEECYFEKLNQCYLGQRQRKIKLDWQLM